MAVKFTKEESDNLLRIMGSVAKAEIAKALGPVHQRLAALEVENAALRAAIKTDDELTVAEMTARYSTLG